LKATLDYPESQLIFLNDTIDEVIICRQFLKWTFVYAHLKLSITKDTLFECNLAILEQTCDSLHEKIETTPFREFLKFDLTNCQFFDECKKDMEQRTKILKKYRRAM
jgi:hypothetical protein